MSRFPVYNVLLVTDKEDQYTTEEVCNSQFVTLTVLSKSIGQNISQGYSVE